MIKVLLSGCNGKMGKVITRLSQQYENIGIVAGFDINDRGGNSYPVYNDISSINDPLDIVVDFSNPAAFENVINFAITRDLPLVMATTGLSQTQIKSMAAASEKIPIFFSMNMSLGVNLLIDLVKKAVKVLEHNFDIEIIEKHHNLKLDAPSGTALTIADAINSILDTKQEYVYDRHSRRRKRSRNEIGIHAIRGGTIVGDHTVLFAGNDELIEIKHSATSRDVFGTGAISALLFLHNKKPGFYSMADLIDDAH